MHRLVSHIRRSAALILVAGLWLAVAPGIQAAQRHGGATSLLNKAFADATAYGSFRQSVSQVYGRTHGTLEDNVALHTGRQVITSSNGTRAQVLVDGKTAYISGNHYALRSYFSFTSDEVAVIGGNWVSIPSTSRAFAAVAYDVTVPTALTEVAPAGHLTEGAAQTLDGQRVIGISGKAPAATAGGGSGTATLYITASRHPLPVRAVTEVSSHGHPKVYLTATMSHWGEHVAVSPPVGQLAVAQLPALAQQLGALAITGAAGYFTFTGPHGFPAPVGRPWGAACKPVVLDFGAAATATVYAQALPVVQAARKQGLDVTAEDRPHAWLHGALFYRPGQSAGSAAIVDVTASGGTPPKLSGGKLEHIALSWNMKVDADKHNEDLTEVQAKLWMRTLSGHPELLRRSIRQLIAWTQGISRTTDGVSGISNITTTDRFTAADIAAMMRMSGCASASGVTGIAA
ncbi:MAG: hypothetical protein KGL15_00480 [Acidobacteriota bacterium]|nr:hypothetical protein [Acidobacteriota bacterium]